MNCDVCNKECDHVICDACYEAIRLEERADGRSEEGSPLNVHVRIFFEEISNGFVAVFEGKCCSRDEKEDHLAEAEKALREASESLDYLERNEVVPPPAEMKKYLVFLRREIKKIQL